MDSVEQLHKIAKSLLKDNKIDILIGYRQADNNLVTPCFIENENEVEKLAWNENCVQNLSVFLKPTLTEIKKEKIGIVAKGCDVKAIIGLIQENQLKRENVVIIGMECYGQKEADDKQFFSKCTTCTVQTPKVNDELIKAEEKDKKTSPEERWDFWNKEFTKCIRCYACREICPFCYCKECVADCNSPQWCSPVPSLKGNTSWNIIRAYHLGGRCVDCGECERACPVDIPLTLLNRALAKEVKEVFNYTPGESWEVKLPLNDFMKEDKEEFIL